MQQPHRNKRIYQFLITLEGIEPTVWRRIQVPEAFSFWDLHMAIQDAFGWTNSHLHEFFYRSKGLKIGMPMDDGFTDPEDLPEAGWEMDIEELFEDVGDSMSYLYDFGDSWSHDVLLEGILLQPKKVKFSRCIDGERMAPPEDCGGVFGYEQLLEVINDPKNEEYKEMIEWLKGQYGRKKFDPDSFDVSSVKFKNPQKQLELWLEN
ncbi:MAG: plasmid pRiA4b ORF-3 family protein [Campylobacterota bacterium]|nr:plasmid pRiA4b ORF-3 family protein [Campylobacterota bacterium]